MFLPGGGKALGTQSINNMSPIWKNRDLFFCFSKVPCWEYKKANVCWGRRLTRPATRRDSQSCRGLRLVLEWPVAIQLLLNYPAPVGNLSSTLLLETLKLHWLTELHLAQSFFLFCCGVPSVAE